MAGAGVLDVAVVLTWLGAGVLDVAVVLTWLVQECRTWPWC